MIKKLVIIVLFLKAFPSDAHIVMPCGVAKIISIGNEYLDRYQWGHGPIIPGREPQVNVNPFGGSGVTVVTGHGFGESPMEMKKWNEYIIGHGVNLISLLLPGHGREPHKLYGGGPGFWRADMNRAVVAAKQMSKKVVILGNSISGTLALDTALDYPDIDVIAFAPPVVITEVARKAYERNLRNIANSPNIESEQSKFGGFPVPVLTVRQIFDLATLFQAKAENFSWADKEVPDIDKRRRVQIYFSPSGDKMVDAEKSATLIRKTFDPRFNQVVIVNLEQRLSHEQVLSILGHPELGETVRHQLGSAPQFWFLR